MSIFWSITCSSCNVTSSYGLYNHVFEGDKDKTPLFSSAWCNKCDQMNYSLVPYTETDFLTFQSDITKKHQGEITRVKNRIAYSRRKFFYFFSKKLKAEVFELEALLSRLEQENPLHEEANLLEITNNKNRVQHFIDNNFSPYCLTCKSTDIISDWGPIPEAAYFSAVPFGIKHKGCNGELLIEEAGHFRVASGVKKVSYDLDGLIQITSQINSNS